MNFPPFGGHFSASIPTIHQFAAKFSHDNSSNVHCQTQETNSNRYTANGVPTFTQHHPPTPQQQQQHLMNSSNAVKYQGENYLNQNNVYVQQPVREEEKRQNFDQQQELAQEICAAMLQHTQQEKQIIDKIKPEPNHEEHCNQQHHQQEQQHQQQQQQQQQQSHNQQVQVSQQNNQIVTSSATMPSTWQSLATPGSTVADYLSHLPASTLPISLHHFLKYSAETLKKEPAPQQVQVQNSEQTVTLLHNNIPNNNINTNILTSTVNTNAMSSNTSVSTNGSNTLSALTTINTAQLAQTVAQTASPKKKKKKKSDKEKKPRPKPGEIRLTTALDGSTLYCCPECHMAYPEKEQLQQHLLGHTLERRFVCDICGAGLKRKDHLTRHKQSHNPERPYVCTVCFKAFKRKEQLTLHFVIHSGEKRHVCTECGKGFYRKDHLRKHTRSHIARRVKAELSQHSSATNGSPQMQLPIATSSISNNTTQDSHYKNGRQRAQTLLCNICTLLLHLL